MQVTVVTEIPKASVGKLDKKRIRQDISQRQAEASVFYPPSRPRPYGGINMTYRSYI